MREGPAWGSAAELADVEMPFAQGFPRAAGTSWEPDACSEEGPTNACLSCLLNCKPA